MLFSSLISLLHSSVITSLLSSFFPSLCPTQRILIPMAVEARHLNLFPPQIPTNREIGSCMEADGNLYSAQMGRYGVVPGPLSGTTTATDAALIPMHRFTAMAADSVPAKTPLKSDSRLSYAIPASRKRSREATAINNHNHRHPLLSSFPANVQNNQHSHAGAGRRSSFTFLGEDISFQIQRQQLEIDRFIAEHTEKVRMEIEERRKRYCRRVMAEVEERITNKLRAKEDEIEKMGKLNWALEERVNFLCLENQIWRELAQTNEATANALRTNLQVVLAQVQDDQRGGGGDAGAALMEDVQSCCGSNYDVVEEANSNNNNGGGIMMKLCRNCGKDEPTVLFLPCRHLSLCSVCGPSLHTCPVCKCTKNATLHVNLSSSP